MGLMMSHIILLVKAIQLATGNPIYSYRFEVYPVDRCPMNSSEFERAAKRRNCTKDTRYLCAPDKYLSNLIEFCSDITKSLYGDGNCLRLAGTGDLNHYNCVKKFTSGCPTTPYTDDEIYTYPMCLAINRNLRCFVAERGCIKGLSPTTDIYLNGSEPGNGEFKEKAVRHSTNFILLIVIVISLLTVGILGIMGFIFYKRRKEHEEDNSNPGLSTSQRKPDDMHTRTVSFSMELEGENEQLISVRAEDDQTDRGKPTEELIKYGADTYRSNNTETPLTVACLKGQLNEVERLIKRGADVNQRDNEKTPLTTACYLGQLDVVEKLIQNGADTNQGDGNETPLTAACYMGHLSVVKKLIKHGVDVNQKDKKGTPLESAYGRGHLSVVRALIDAKAKTLKIYEHDRDFWNLFAESKDTNRPECQSKKAI